MIKLAIALLVIAGPAFAQLKLYSTHVDMRTTVALKVPDNAAQKMLPQGWELNVPAGGAAKGANLALVLVEQLLAYDDAGKPKEPARGVALVIPAKKTGADTAGAMVVAGLFNAGYSPGPYDVYMPAQVAIERRQRTDGDGKVLAEERWTMKGPGGHEIDVQVAYVRGAPSKVKSDSRGFSAARPEFYRIYRAESVSDVVRSVPNGENRVSFVSLKVNGQKFAPLFDGSEKIVAITSIPSFSREILLPTN